MPDWKQIAKDYRAGESLNSISSRVGINKGVISVRLTGMRVKMRARGRKKKEALKP